MYGAQGGSGDLRLGRGHELDEAREGARVEHGLDPVVLAVAQVAERPAGVLLHLAVLQSTHTSTHMGHMPRRVRAGEGNGCVKRRKKKEERWGNAGSRKRE